VLKKTFDVAVKAATDEATGQTMFTGYAAVFGNVDLGGDMIVKGAFTDTLREKYPQGGAGIPIYWNHSVSDPFANLGLTTSAVEDDHGLLVQGTVDESTDFGKRVAVLLKEGRVCQMSFAFDVKEGAFVETEDGWYYELRKLDLFEVSICPIGMNQETEIVSVKALKEQAGERPARTTPPPADAGALAATGAREPTDSDACKSGHLETAARRLRALTL
jgi:HK97 family phage prohead protease